MNAELKLCVTDIEDCTLPETVQKNTWAKMKQFASERTLGSFDTDIAIIENEFCEKYFDTVPEAKTSGGKWKKSYKNASGERVHILPNPWKTSKSIVRSALDLGIDFADLGQKECQNKINALRSEKRTPNEVLKAKAHALVKTFYDCNEQLLLSPRDIDELGDILAPITYCLDNRS